MGIGRLAAGARSVEQQGFTLVEVLVALVIATLIAGATSAAMIMTFRTTKSTEGRVESSSSGFQTNARFVDDISSATPIESALAVSRGQQGCGGDANSVLRVLARSGDDVEVRSYSIAQAGAVLERRTCSGNYLAAALAATPHVNEVTSDLASGAGAVNVTCRANAGAVLAPATPAGDAQCRIVTLAVKTRTGFEFQLEGHRDTTQSPAASIPNVKKCTLLSSGDAWVTSYPPNTGTNYGRDWHNNTFRRSGYATGNGELQTYIVVDLLGPCTGSGEPPFLPGGRTITSATFSLWLYDIRTGSNLEDHGLTALGDKWDEAAVTWDDHPYPKAGAIKKVFDAWPKDQGFTVQVLDDVTNWYSGAWPNYGWVLARNQGNDSGTDNGFWWGARESSDLRHWPRLTVTWE